MPAEREPAPASGRPRVSVVIPTYDRVDGLRQALASVLRQKPAHFEVIIVDDGSNSAAEVERAVAAADDGRVRLHRQRNRGRTAARNAGAALARADLLTFLDDDDEALSGWLTSLVEPFADERVGVVCCGEELLLARGSRQIEHVRLPRDLGPVYDHHRGLFRTGTFALRRELFESLEGYAEELAFSENTDLALRLLPECRRRRLEVVCVARPLVRIHAARPAGDPRVFRERLQSAAYILRHHGERYRRTYPRGYANYCGIAGVNAARLSEYAESRRFFLDGVRVCPWYWRGYGRLLLSLFPAAARRAWLKPGRRQARPAD